MRSATLVLTAAAFAAVPTYAADASADYPRRPVRLIVPFPPGGGTDILARVLAQKITAAWGQQLVVDNRPGAGGTLGSRLLLDAQPDGYTLLMGTTSTHAIGPHTYAKPPYDAERDFAAIDLVATSPNVLMVSAVLPVKNVKELIALAKAKPGTLNFGSSGVGTQFHLSGELLKLLAGIDIVHIPYKGTALVYPDMFSGQIALLFDVPPVGLPHIQSGRVRALGVSGARRVAVLPDVPTVAEAGVPGYDADLWFAVFGPARLPRELVVSINRSFNQVLQQADVKERYAVLGAEPVGSTPERLAAHLKAENEKWAKVVKAAGVKAE
jgi:tripartite-type tricarboxylate transporter receptor subunit TctC